LPLVGRVDLVGAARPSLAMDIASERERNCDDQCEDEEGLARGFSRGLLQRFLYRVASQPVPSR